MKIEQELKTNTFKSEQHKAQLNILFTSSWLRNRIGHLLKSFKLSQEQYNVLRILRGSHPKALCVKDITCRMIDRNSNTTRIIDKLEAKGYVARQASESDRRELHIQITETGLAFTEQVMSAMDASPSYITPLTNEESSELNRLLDKMRD